MAQDQLLRFGERLVARGLLSADCVEELLPSAGTARELCDLIAARGLAESGRLRDILNESALGTISAPTLLARYERVGRLGEGAMAVVYEAVDRQLDRRVALKLPKDRT